MKLEQYEEQEKSYECTIREMWDAIPKVEKDAYNVFPSGCGETVYLFKVRDMEDVKVINAYLHIYANESADVDILDTGSIGKEIMVILSEMSWYYLIGTKEEVIASIEKNITNLLNELNGKREKHD